MEDVTDIIENCSESPGGYPYGVAYRGDTVAWFARRDDAVDIAFYFQFQDWVSKNLSVQEFMDHMVHFCAPVDR